MQVKLSATIIPFVTRVACLLLPFKRFKKRHRKSDRHRVFRLNTSHHECELITFAPLPSISLHVSMIVCILINHVDWIERANLLCKVFKGLCIRVGTLVSPLLQIGAAMIANTFLPVLLSNIIKLDRGVLMHM